MVTKEEVLEKLKTVYDPELGVNIVDLGLIYDVQIKNGDIKIDMTMTSPMCPVAASLVEQSKEAVNSIKGVAACEIELVWEPAWTPDRMSEDAKMQLGMI